MFTLLCISTTNACTGLTTKIKRMASFIHIDLLGFFLTSITVTKTGKELLKDDIKECDFYDLIFSKMKRNLKLVYKLFR